MANEDLRQYHAIITDAWHVFKAGMADASDDPAWWDKVIQALREMSAKYDDHPFALDMARVMIDELERRVRE